jgi:hypothetical protein
MKRRATPECAVGRCHRPARARRRTCEEHVGRRACRTSGCTSMARAGSGCCDRHRYGQCTASGCHFNARGKNGLCRAHGSALAPSCAVEGCTADAADSVGKKCLAHATHLTSVCSVVGCPRRVNTGRKRDRRCNVHRGHLCRVCGGAALDGKRLLCRAHSNGPCHIPGCKTPAHQREMLTCFRHRARRREVTPLDILCKAAEVAEPSA